MATDRAPWPSGGGQCSFRPHQRPWLWADALLGRNRGALPPTRQQSLFVKEQEGKTMRSPPLPIDPGSQKAPRLHPAPQELPQAITLHNQCTKLCLRGKTGWRSCSIQPLFLPHVHRHPAHLSLDLDSQTSPSEKSAFSNEQPSSNPDPSASPASCWDRYQGAREGAGLLLTWGRSRKEAVSIEPIRALLPQSPAHPTITTSSGVVGDRSGCS